MEEHGIECSTEPQRPHVAVDVLAFRVQFPAEREHPVGHVRESALEVSFQVMGVVPCAGPELEQRGRLAHNGTPERGFERRGLIEVVGRRVDEPVPRRQLGIELSHRAMFAENDSPFSAFGPPSPFELRRIRHASG